MSEFGSCQHCYEQLESHEFVCQHCKAVGNPDLVCEPCYEAVHEYHEDDGFISECYACHWEDKNRR